MSHMSNRERIARAAEEARLADEEKAAKKVAKPGGKAGAKPGAGKRSKPAVRMKIVWEVCNSGGKVLKTFPYPDKADAEAAVDALKKSTGSEHTLQATKVPME